MEARRESRHRGREARLEWFKNAMLKKVPISRGILCEKAENLNDDF